MSKWYECTIVRYKTFSVEVSDDETDEDALNYAKGEFSDGEIDTEECSLLCSDEEIECSKRHADEILFIGD